MKKVSVYRTSAEDIFNRKAKYCCEAIADKTLDYINLIENFSYFFKPEHTEQLLLWFGEDNDQNREHRILSLLLMSEIYNQNSETKEISNVQQKSKRKWVQANSFNWDKNELSPEDNRRMRMGIR